MYFTLCIFSAGLRTEEPFAMLSRKKPQKQFTTLLWSPKTLNYLPFVSREWKNGSNSSYDCTPFLHSLLAKGKTALKGSRLWEPRGWKMDLGSLAACRDAEASNQPGLDQLQLLTLVAE